MLAMAAEKTRIAVVGAGHVAQVAHIPSYRSNPDAELVAIVDYDPVKAKRIKAQFGFHEWYEDFNTMLRKSNVHAVDICTPNYLHAPMAIAALRSGRDVMCEKPMARNAKEAQQMVDAAESNDRILMVAMNNRFREDALTLQKFVGGNELGDINIVKAGWLRHATDWKDRAWFTERGKAGGGALLDLGTPLVDLSMWISGLKKTTGVSCSVFGKKGKDAVEDSACAMVRFAGGACLMLEVNWNLRDPRDVVYLQVYGARGAGVLSPLQVHKSIQGVLVNVTPALGKQKNYYKESYQAEIDHFIQCVRKQKAPLTSGKDALTVMKIMDAMYESASTGREVELAG
jgi:predicted dehydrogenase